MDKFILAFLFYSFGGWLFESIYMIIKEGIWENRGFLFGPICPIYGTGAMAITTLHQWHPFTMLQTFIICVIGATVLELITSFSLEKFFHASWWDYHDMPFNFQGRVSLFSSLWFGIMGISIISFFHPIVEKSLDKISEGWTEPLMLVFVIIVTVDFTLTINALISLQNIIMEMQESFDEKMETFVSATHERTATFKNFVLGKLPSFSLSERAVLQRIKYLKRR